MDARFLYPADDLYGRVDIYGRTVMKRLNFNFRTMDQRQWALTSALLGAVLGIVTTNVTAFLPLLIMIGVMAGALAFMLVAASWVAEGDYE
jgi:hypothetical protein